MKALYKIIEIMKVCERIAKANSRAKKLLNETR